MELKISFSPSWVGIIGIKVNCYLSHIICFHWEVCFSVTCRELYLQGRAEGRKRSCTIIAGAFCIRSQACSVTYLIRQFNNGAVLWGVCNIKSYHQCLVQWSPEKAEKNKLGWCLSSEVASGLQGSICSILSAMRSPHTTEAASHSEEPAPKGVSIALVLLSHPVMALDGC